MRLNHPQRLLLCSAALLTTPQLSFAQFEPPIRGGTMTATAGDPMGGGGEEGNPPPVALTPFENIPKYRHPVLSRGTYGEVTMAREFRADQALASVGGPGLAPTFEAVIRLGGEGAGVCGASCGLRAATMNAAGTIFTLTEEDGTPRTFDLSAGGAEQAPEAGSPFAAATLTVRPDSSFRATENDGRSYRDFDGKRPGNSPRECVRRNQLHL